MSDNLKEKLSELYKYLDSEYEAWRAREKALDRPKPTEDRFCSQVLGIGQSTYSRIKAATEPRKPGDIEPKLVAPSDLTLLTLTFNLGSMKPLKIFKKEHLLANDPQALEIATRLRRASPQVRDAVAYLLDHELTVDDLSLDKINAAPA